MTNEKDATVFSIFIVGRLAHDNHLFDRACPKCKTMYSSLERSTCKRCGSQLAYILSNKTQKPMSISEGTVYVSWGKDQAEKNRKALESRKGSVEKVFRFKLFSFADENGILTPPALHGRCKTGAKVQLLSRNHATVDTPFRGMGNSGNIVEKVEEMITIYEDTKDYFKILADAEYADKTVSHPVDNNGKPIPIQTNEEVLKELLKLREEVKQLKQERTQTASAVPDPMVEADYEPPQWEPSFIDGIGPEEDLF